MLSVRHYLLKKISTTIFFCLAHFSLFLYQFHFFNLFSKKAVLCNDHRLLGFFHEEKKIEE